METPQDSLQHYFDDLLGDPLATEELAPSAKSGLQEAPPVNEPVKKAPVQPARQGAKAVEPRPFAEPSTLSPEQEHREKLAKLLETARLQAVKAEPEVKVEAKAEVKTEVKVDKAPPKIEEVSPQLKTATEVSVEEAVVAQAPEADALILNQASEVQSLEWEANGRPSWAQERFDVLLFDVAGLTLAVPLIALGQIQPLTDELTPLFGQADWFMGLQPTPVGKIRTVNTAKFVMPERYDESFLDSAKYVVSISGLPWGLAVDKVDQPITLEPEDVKWRGERSKRAWLAGTVKAHMCALIDIPMMGQMLQSEDANAS